MLNFDWSVGRLLTSESVHSFLSFKVTKIVIKHYSITLSFSNSNFSPILLLLLSILQSFSKAS